MKIFYWKNKIDDEELIEVIKVLDNDGLIIYPTDTVYGLACNCFSEKAIKKIYEIKKRPAYKPINVLTDSVDKMSLVAKNIKGKDVEIIGKYMPGEVTLILDKREKVPNIITAGLDTIGVRIPNNEIALTILKQLDFPLATTSVNISGEKAGVEIADFIEEFGDKVDIIIDGGKTESEEVSTIVQTTDEGIKVLRQGKIKVN